MLLGHPLSDSQSDSQWLLGYVWCCDTQSQSVSQIASGCWKSIGAVTPRRPPPPPPLIMHLILCEISLIDVLRSVMLSYQLSLCMTASRRGARGREDAQWIQMIKNGGPGNRAVRLKDKLIVTGRYCVRPPDKWLGWCAFSSAATSLHLIPDGRARCHG